MLRRSILLLAVLCLGRVADAQQAVSSIEQARLLQGQQPTGVNTNVNADGTPLAAAGESNADESFGAQPVLKERERHPSFAVSGDTSFVYTSNAALTPHHTEDDGFFLADAGVSWLPQVAPNVDVQLGTRASLFRYVDHSALDFESVGATAAIGYRTPECPGLSFFARYDFTELLDRHSSELLSDHEFTVGAQKVFALTETQALTVGAAASAGISDPFSAQRDQLGLFAAYHVEISRSLAADFAYRFGVHFYNDNGRVDENQLVSAALRWRLNEYADIEAFTSFSDNESNRSRFRYDVFTTGAGLALNVRF